MQKNKIHFHLLLSISFAIALVFLRIKITNSEYYIFLIWNLFLAGIPYLISQTLKNHIWLQKSKIMSVLCFGTWLLFLPNSPYIITDIIHLQNGNSNLAWYDLILVFVFAFNGLLLGLLSMLDMYSIIASQFSKRITDITLVKISFLTGYGIYLGRFLRFNSWDIISNPKHLFIQSLESIQDPKAYLISFVFGGFIWILFSLLNSYAQINNKQWNSLKN